MAVCPDMVRAFFLVKKQMVKRSSPRRNKTQSSHRKDKTGGKRYPNAIGAIVVAICKSHLNRTQPELFPDDNMSFEKFVENSNFDTVFQEAKDRYPGVSRPPDRLDEMLEKMGRGESTDMPYYRLRALADYMGIPVGVLLMFAQFVSLERRIDDIDERKAGLLQLIYALRRFVDAAEAMVVEPTSQSTSDGFRFSHFHNHDKDMREIWVADIDRFEELCRRFSDGDLDVVEAASLKR